MCIIYVCVIIRLETVKNAGHNTYLLPSNFSFLTLFLRVPLLSSCSPRLLWGGVSHLVFGQERCPCGPRGTTAQPGSCGSAGRASIQLCPGFGFWHGPVPGEQNNSEEAFKNPLKLLSLTTKVKWPTFSLEWYSNLYKEWQQDKILPLTFVDISCLTRCSVPQPLKFFLKKDFFSAKS